MSTSEKKSALPAVFVQVRNSSKRLPGKVMMDIGGQTLIQRLHDRLVNLQPLPVYFLTSNDPSDEILIEHFEEHDISYIRGSLSNVLERFIQAGETLGFEQFFRIGFYNFCAIRFMVLIFCVLYYL